MYSLSRKNIFDLYYTGVLNYLVFLFCSFVCFFFFFGVTVHVPSSQNCALDPSLSYLAHWCSGAQEIGLVTYTIDLDI